jgi:hypothetical protein
MPKTLDLNRKVNIKQRTNADIPQNLGMPVMNRFEAAATAAQSVINLNFSVQASDSDNILVIIDGKVLSKTGNYSFTSVDQSGNSSQITLNAPMAEGTSIEVIKLGAKRDQELQTDSRFTQLYDVMGKGFEAFVDESFTIAVPNTQIVNRKRIPDLANDLKARFGVERIAINRVTETENEFGPAGERVFSVLGDSRDLIRFVGYGWTNTIDANGFRPISTTSGDYLEVTFYGTALNLLVLGGSGSPSPDVRVSVDGGAEGGNIWPVANTLLSGRNYNPNNVIPATSNLALGLHTVKVRLANAPAWSFGVSGVEILCETQNVRVRPGTASASAKKISLISEAQQALTTGFESIVRDGASVSTIGARGARVVTYLKSDGSVAKAATAVNSAQANLTSADHTYEDIIRVYRPREFGANRSDDFSTLTPTNSSRAFTLEDGTTTLTALQGRIDPVNGVEGVAAHDGTSNFVSLTFVGTGLDVEILASGGTLSMEVFVNNTSIGTISTSGSVRQLRKVVSGLPYGTHVVRFQNLLGGTNSPWISRFITYAPKKPSIPSGAIELAEHFLMADYVPTSAASVHSIGSGLLRKTATREFTYLGASWSVGFSPAANIAGYEAGSNASGSARELSFYGTGFEIRGEAGGSLANNVQLSLNGVNLTLANFPSLVSSSTSGWTFTNTTGVLNMTTGSGDGHMMRVSGLPLALYRLRIQNNTTSVHWIDTVDVITPVHSPVASNVEIQNTLPIGSCAIADSRKRSPVESLVERQKFRGVATGVTSSPTTTSTTVIPLPDMSLTVPSKGGWFKVDFGANASNNGANNQIIMQLYANSAPVSGTRWVVEVPTANRNFPVNLSKQIYLPAGVHKLDMYWRVNGGTATLSGSDSELTISEI